MYFLVGQCQIVIVVKRAIIFVIFLELQLL